MKVKKVKCKLDIGFLFAGYYYDYKINKNGLKYSVKVPLGYYYNLTEEDFRKHFYSVVEERKEKLEKLKNAI